MTTTVAALRETPPVRPAGPARATGPTRPAIRRATPRTVRVAGGAGAWLYGGSAVFAAGTAAVTHLGPHRVWGQIAAVAYGLGALAAVTGRGRRRPDAVAWGVAFGAVLVPLAVLVLNGWAQPEVGVVERAGARLWEHGTPYLGPDDLHGGYEAYNPYLPGMALLGIPDARLVFGAVLVGALALAGPCRGPVGQGRGTAGPVASPPAAMAAVAALVASPVVALPMAVGGDDLPVIGLVCLGLSLAGRGRDGAAGLVLGLAGTLKATAWPALAVCLVLVAVRRGRARRYAGAAGGVLALGVLVPFAVDPSGFVENAVRFPLGLAGAASPADSPLPGRLLAELGPYGHAAALAALGAAAAGMAVWLFARPPRDVRAAAYRIAVGLALATALMPASRWGYLVYPAVLGVWARLRREEELCLAA
ncbi:glycosyltransferase 87 family protein [Actinomadura yumaensis]|uniref:Glycosyltransferase 87 family protein n=1 Tax=Actinomadura yumaensis TaxID=111807 RepID=A0ABW2CA13_9ACTN